METAAGDRIFWRRKLVPRQAGRVNVGDAERLGSLAIGAVLIGASFRRGPLGRVLLGGLGALAMARGISGHSRVYESVGVSSSDLAHGTGISVDENVTINAPLPEVFGRWTDVAQLPRYLPDVRSVTRVSPGVTHWVVELPGGREIAWDAEVIDEHENEFVAWRTLPDSDVEHSGSVRFREVPGRGTELQLKVRFVPPGGVPGFAFARLAQAIQRRAAADELRRFKAIVEAGEAPTTEGQTSGRESAEEWPPLVASAPVSSGLPGTGGAGMG